MHPIISCFTVFQRKISEILFISTQSSAFLLPSMIQGRIGPGRTGLGLGGLGLGLGLSGSGLGLGSEPGLYL